MYLPGTSGQEGINGVVIIGETGEFAVDAAVSPGRVLSRHVDDEAPDLGIGGMCDTAPSNVTADIYDATGTTELVDLGAVPPFGYEVHNVLLSNCPRAAMQAIGSADEE